MSLEGVMSIQSLCRNSRGGRVCMCVNMHHGVIRPYLQGDACYDIQGVDDIAQGFAHLASVGVPHHGVQINLQERERRERQTTHPVVSAHFYPK